MDEIGSTDGERSTKLQVLLDEVYPFSDGDRESLRLQRLKEDAALAEGFGASGASPEEVERFTPPELWSP